jgi:hypothetical protein
LWYGLPVPALGSTTPPLPASQPPLSPTQPHNAATLQELKKTKAYTALRVARNDAKLAGIRKGKAGKGDDKAAGDE